MKRYIKSSYGDVILHKFVFIPSELIAGVDEDNYDNTLTGYFYLWSYTYNKLNHHTDDRMFSHADVIDSLPLELKRKDRIWGRSDWYRNSKEIFINDRDSLTEAQIQYIESKL